MASDHTAVEDGTVPHMIESSELNGLEYSLVFIRRINVQNMFRTPSLRD
jgi:hypothetical protein